MLFPLVVNFCFVIVASSSSSPAIATTSEAVQTARAKRWSMTGPVLTLTLRDPAATARRRFLSSTVKDDNDVYEDNGNGNGNGVDAANSNGPTTPPSRSSSLPRLLPRLPSFGFRRQRSTDETSMFSSTTLSTLAPVIRWSIASTTPPLPNIVPYLRSTSLTTTCVCDEKSGRASPLIEGGLRFGAGGAALDLVPTFDIRSGRVRVSAKVGMDDSESFSVAARFSSGGGKILEHLRASFKRNLPLRSVSVVAIVPSYDFLRNAPSCHISGKSGSGRTAAVFDWNLNDPSISVLHAIDERNTISPEISLKTGRIQYSWNVSLDSGSIRTVVDPLSAVRVTWIDRSMNGKWVTDVSLPLEGPTTSESASSSSFVPHVRVRKQFVF